MNGNANLNADNLTAENVQQWRTKLNIGGGSATDVQIDGTSITSGGVANIKTINGNYNENTNKMATQGDLPDISTKQDKIDSSHKLSADLLQNGTTNKVFTATEQSKLSGIESGAQVNAVTSVNGQTGAVVVDSEALYFRASTQNLENGDTQILPLTLHYNTSGAKMTLDEANGAVTIGAGVSRVKITMLLSLYQNTPATRFGASVKKNGNNFSGDSSFISGSSNYQYSQQQVINICECDVSQNDVLTFFSRSAGYSSGTKDQVRGYQTRFLLEVLN